MANDASNESPTSHSGPRQIHCPRRRLLVEFGGGAGSSVDKTILVRIPTPDSRIRGKFGLFGAAQPPGTAPGRVILAGRGLMVWPYASEDDQAGGATPIPVSDMIPTVTQAAPLAIPVHAGLGGFGREFVTIADNIELEITVPAQAPGGTAGALYLQGRFQPDASSQIIPWNQWDEIRSLMEFQVPETLRIP